MFVGASLAGSLSDHYGRKTMFPLGNHRERATQRACRWLSRIVPRACAIGAWFFGQVALEASDVPLILFWGSVISFFNLGAWGVVFMAVMLFGAVIVLALGEETRGRSLEEIASA